MLKPGGRLVYSTCSMNPIEDEAVVAAALIELGADHFALVDLSAELPALKRRAGLDTWRVRANGEWYSRFDEVPSKVRRCATSRRSSAVPAGRHAGCNAGHHAGCHARDTCVRAWRPVDGTRQCEAT